MLRPTDSVQVNLYADPVDMRKAIDGLSALVELEMNLPPNMKALFMVEYIKFGCDHNIRHYHAEAYQSKEYWRQGLKLFALVKLLWNPDLDVNKLLNDWYLVVAGPKGAP